MPTTWITYKNRKILYVDYRGLKTMEKKEEFLNTAKQAGEMIRASKEKVLIFTDFRDCSISPEFMERMKTSFPTEKVEKHALIGVEGIKKLLLDSFKKATGNIPEVFETETEAKNFLVS